MIDFIPWMILSTVVVLLVAGWGAMRSGVGRPGSGRDMERLRDAEQAFADCFAAAGVPAPRLEVYRDPDTGGLIIVGPPDLDDRAAAVLADCDRQVAARFAPG